MMNVHVSFSVIYVYICDDVCAYKLFCDMYICDNECVCKLFDLCMNVVLLFCLFFPGIVQDKFRVFHDK